MRTFTQANGKSLIRRLKGTGRRPHRETAGLAAPTQSRREPGREVVAALWLWVLLPSLEHHHYGQPSVRGRPSGRPKPDRDWVTLNHAWPSELCLTTDNAQLMHSFTEHLLCAWHGSRPRGGLHHLLSTEGETGPAQKAEDLPKVPQQQRWLRGALIPAPG